MEGTCLRFSGRPYWLVTGACEPIGDIFSDRLWCGCGDTGGEVICEDACACE
ncbi:MAG: hypothetical protein HQK57_10865 [Deltaproteobacteria bacterium]|nr:hypothetical protein [Deltaproteobacteria bacterium]MBF0526365.1 hypothetical protein [Deltaproteobacteria bacterium]